VWTTDRYLEYLAVEGKLHWPDVEVQIRRAVLASFTAAYDRFTEDGRRAAAAAAAAAATEAASGSDQGAGGAGAAVFAAEAAAAAEAAEAAEAARRSLFSHWRFDFLLDASGKAWLLEAEIVPSTGTIGGVDEVIKTVVLRDVLSLAGWGPQQAPWEAGDSAENSGSGAAYYDDGDFGSDGGGGPAPMDLALCAAQAPGSWSRRLCDARLLGKSPPSRASLGPKALAALRRSVVATLAAAEDPLAGDGASVDVIVRHELHRRRRVGYEPLAPVAHAGFVGGGSGGSSGYGQGYVAFDGSTGFADAALTAAEQRFLATKALPSDLALWRWVAAKAKAATAAAPVSGVMGDGTPGPVSAEASAPWSSLPLRSVAEARAACSACVGGYRGSVYCSSVAGVSNSSSDGGPPALLVRGACQGAEAGCRDRPTGFVDGVALASADQCEASFGEGGAEASPAGRGSKGLGAGTQPVTPGRVEFVWRTNAHAVARYRPLIDHYCTTAALAAGAGSSGRDGLPERLRVAFGCGTAPAPLGDAGLAGSAGGAGGAGGGEAAMRAADRGGTAPVELTRAEYLRRGGLAALVADGVPVVIRADPGPALGGEGSGGGNGATAALAAAWSPAALKASLGRAGVRALIYDQALDGAQALFTSEVAFSDFVDWARDPSSFTVDPGGGSDGVVGSSGGAQSLALYLLLTTRSAFEASQRTGDGALPPAGLATNPNGDLSEADAAAVAALLAAAAAAFADDGLPGSSAHDHRAGGAGGMGGGVGSGGARWAEAWTSLRLGGRYTYPTHIDCFENLILQLHGTKTVHLLPPEHVAAVRPDPGRKHWPTSGAGELSAAYARSGWTARLAPGDELYVPLMWFHSVEVGGSDASDARGSGSGDAPDGGNDWSATANRYYYLADNVPHASGGVGGGVDGSGGRTAWDGHVAARKGPEWQRFEAEARVALC